MSDPTSQVTHVIHAFADCWNRHDIRSFALLFAQDAEFVNVVGLWWQGREEIEKAHRFTHATLFRNSRLTIESVAVRYPSERVALARARWLLEDHLSPEGAALPPRKGILLNILSLGPSGWTIIDSQNTDIVEDQFTRPQ